MQVTRAPIVRRKKKKICVADQIPKPSYKPTNFIIDDHAREVSQKMWFEHIINKGFSNKEEIVLFAKEFLGFTIPTISPPSCLEKGHCPPADFLADLILEKVDSALLFASRTSGKTRIVSIANILDMLTKPKIDIASAGATLDQAGRAYQYFTEYATKKYIAPYMTSSIQSYSHLANDATLEILTGTIKGMNSPHVCRLRLDEVELMPWAVLEEAFSITLSKYGYRAQDVLSSTRKYSTGVMQKLLNEAHERNMRVYQFCVFDSLIQCTRDCVDHGVKCPAYSKMSKDKEIILCGGKAHHSRGWYSIDDFIKKCKIMSLDTLQVQWFNDEPRGGALVYGNYYDDKIHAIDWSDFKTITGFDVPQKDWFYISGIDFGRNFIYLTLCRDPRGRWFGVFEYYTNKDVTMSIHATNVKLKSPFEVRQKHLRFHDPAGRQDAIELQKLMRIQLVEAEKDLEMGVNCVKEFLEMDSELGTARLYLIKDACPETVRAFKSWSHAIDRDGSILEDAYEDDDNKHAMDAIRYALYTMKLGKGVAYVNATRTQFPI
jgi:hypothetical protein